MPAAWAAGPAGSARAERTNLDFKALLGQLSEVLSKMFAAEGPSIDPLGGATPDTGPHIDPWGGATSDEGPDVNPWG
jgi:hypothetical protein